MPPVLTTAPPRRALRRVAAGVVIACAALNVGVAIGALIAQPSLNSDFLAFWSFPRFAAAHPAAGLYDAGALMAFQQTLYPGFKSFYPYLYPPTLLPAIWWLGWFKLAAAETIWTVAGVAALALGGLAFFGRRGGFPVLAMLASPAALLTGATGETAFFTTALLLAGFAALPARPILAGLCFGLLTLKPQLGLLIPFALVALGAWRAIFAASVTALALVALSCAVLPPGLWLDWAQTLPRYQAQYFAAVHALNLNIIVTPAANFVVLGGGMRAAWALQWVCTVAIAGSVFLAFRRAPYRLAVAALFAGMFLAVPHAYAYDTIPLTAALALAARASGTSWPAAILAAVVYLMPFLLLTPASGAFLYAIPEAIMYLAIIRLAFVQPDIEARQNESDPRRLRV
jgi:hypothetical protein